MAVVVVLAVLGGACRPQRHRGETGHADTVRVGGISRTYVLRAPAARTTRRGPLLLAFHGTGQSGREMQGATGLDTLADTHGFLIAYLDAAVGNWAEGCGCSRADLEGVDDTGFVRAVVADVTRRYRVDRARVYAAGFSQGGLFVHRLACELADVVVAVASVAAPMSSRLAETCAPAVPVSILLLQGTLDDVYPYEGQRAGGRSLLGARETARFWRTLNGCTGGAHGREWPDRAADGTRVLAERWDACQGGAVVRLYSVEGGRHAWTPSADVPTETLLMDHFRAVRDPP